MSKIALPAFEMNVEVTDGLFAQDTVFIHGNLASNRWWIPSIKVWQATAKQGLRGRGVFAEWRGCGKSAAPRVEEELHPAVLAADYVELARSMGLKKAHLVGHSTGGLIALFAMLQAPELFDRAVLLDPVSAKGVAFEKPMYDAFTQMSQSRAVCGVVIGSTIHANHPGDPGFENLVDDAFGVAKLIWHGVPTQLAKVDVREQLASIQNRVLVLHGQHDTLLPIDGSREMARLLPNAEFKEIPGQGHSTNFENPKLFVELVNQFLG